LAWQVQEAMRRFLFAEFRYRSAVLGDALSYLGQAVGVAVLAWSGALTLPAVFIVLGSTSLLGALVQCAQVGVSFRVPEDLVRRARDHWTLGSWSLAGSVVSALRFQLPFWLLALVSGRTELATLQAMLNVINVMNPVLIGICNLVPPTAARAFDGSWSSAWSATRPYVILGFVPTAAYAFFVFAAPEHVLRLLYGAESPYTGEGLAVRVLAISLVLNYVGEMVCSFLHGVGAPQMAWLMNLASLVAVFFAFIAFYPWLGWLAAILAIALGQGIRLLVSYAIVKRAGGSAYARLA
jgi:O-antigen/teichoic acid export membrane protein